MQGLYRHLLILFGYFLNVTLFLKTGTSPSSPNNALRHCMRAAGYYRASNERDRNTFLTSMQKWCSVHERVLPCVRNSIENNSHQSPSDWFFSMTFDFKMAKKTSVAMCKKLKKIGKKFKCIGSASLNRARRCVKTLTMPLRQTLTGLYVQNKTDSYDARRLACIISAATATCYKEKIRSCRSYLRDYIGAYHVILGGKCLSVLPVATEETVNSSITMPEEADKNWVTIVQSLLKEVGIEFPSENVSEMQSTTEMSLQSNSSLQPLTTESDVIDESTFISDTDDNENAKFVDYGQEEERGGNDSMVNTTNERDLEEHSSDTNIENNTTLQVKDITTRPDTTTNRDDNDSNELEKFEDDGEVKENLNNHNRAYTFTFNSTESPLNRTGTSISATSSLSEKSVSSKLSISFLSFILSTVFVISITFD